MSQSARIVVVGLALILAGCNSGNPDALTSGNIDQNQSLADANAGMDAIAAAPINAETDTAGAGTSEPAEVTATRPPTSTPRASDRSTHATVTPPAPNTSGEPVETDETTAPQNESDQSNET